MMTTLIPDNFPQEVKNKLNLVEVGSQKNNASISAYQQQLTDNDYRIALEATGLDTAKYSTQNIAAKLPPDENSFWNKYKTYIIIAAVLVTVSIAFVLFKKK